MSPRIETEWQTHTEQPESHKQAAFPFSFKNMYAYLLVCRSKSQGNIKKLSENPRLLTYHVKIFAEGQNKTLITSPGLFQIICESRLWGLDPRVTRDKECKTPPLIERVPAVLQEERRPLPYVQKQVPFLWYYGQNADALAPFPRNRTQNIPITYLHVWQILKL